MQYEENKKIIEKLWQLFSEQKWLDAKKLFHRDFVAEWPQSRERFIGADNFVDMNEAYPGNHTLEILNIMSSGDRVVTAIYIHADTGQKAFATSFFDIKDSKIFKVIEFWGEPYDAPASRAKWATPL
jgi:hypothetical protein